MASSFFGRLENRGVIRLGGEDRRAFLQGLISNDIGLCTQESAIYAALLTPQGKFLHDLFIIEGDGDYLIDCEEARAEDLLKRLAAYKLRAKVTLADARGEFEVWGIRNQKSDVGCQKIYVDPRLPELGERMLVKKGVAPAGKQSIFAEYDRHRLALGVADGSRDMLIEKSTLAEGNFDLLNGVSWSKGCYVGQELTARMHYRALVKKRMFPVRIEGDAPAFGAAIKVGDEEIGDMRSSCGDRGLVLLNVEKAHMAIQKNTALTCGASRLIATKPAWMS